MSTPETRYGFGQPASAEEIAGWDIDVAADGNGLPAGSGTVAQGKELYDRLGAKCHGAKGEGGEGGPPLVGGIGSLNTDTPLKTVGSAIDILTEAVKSCAVRPQSRATA